jgi:hypothetical protein
VVVMLPVVALVPGAAPAFELATCSVALVGTPANSSARTTAFVELLNETVTALEPALMPIEYQSSTRPLVPVRAVASE